MAPNALKPHQFKLKGRLYTFTVLQLTHGLNEGYEHHLDELISQAPKMFENMPIVLDLASIHDESFDLQGFVQALRSRNVFPIAVQGANAFMVSVAQCLGLPALHASSTNDKALLEITEEENTSSKHALGSKIITSPVRSGQQVVGKGADLVVVSAVSHGAELLADGNIHIYGALRGRALAGISGDKNARIFCQSLDAELVSIAGYYRLSDAIDPIDGPCQIFLHNEHIHIEPIC